ncbi:MAG: response regulator [Bacteroidota bacterium]
METILVVDDDSIIRVMIEKLLADEGYGILKAENGAEAQRIVRDQGKEIVTVLLDWSMPVMNGIEFLRWMKSEPEFGKIPVVMQTGMNSPEHIREGIEAGAFYYLVKPLQKNILRSIVRSAISDYRFKETLKNRLKESENPFKNLEEGSFRYRTGEEAEYLAIRIANASPRPEQVMVISELFLNAVEHGLLEITYDEKTDLIANKKLHEEVHRRLALPENLKKSVHVQILKNDDGMTVTIQDEGKGFDFRKYLVIDESRVFDNHGRGIAIARSMLDIDYLGNGNTVCVKVPFHHAAGHAP